MEKRKEKIVSTILAPIEAIKDPIGAYQLGAEFWKPFSKASSEIDEFSILSRILILEELGEQVSNEITKSVYFGFAAMMSGELGVILNDPYYLGFAKSYFHFCNPDLLSPQFRYQILFRKGRNQYYIYRLLKSKFEDQNIDFDYYTNVKETLFNSQNLIQFCFTKIIIEKEIDNKQLEKFILIHMALLTAELNRWTEFSYYLNLIDEDKRDEGFYLTKALNLDAYLDKTHSTIFKSLVEEIIKNCDEAVSFGSISMINKDSTLSIKNKNLDLLSNLEIDDVTQENNKFVKHTEYRLFCLENGLALNEHSIYCSCSLSRRDNLKIRTKHKHTHKKWLSKFQILIDQLQSDFDLARLSYYNSLQDSLKGLNLGTFERQSNEKRILIDPRSRMLINSFKQTYSILDRVAVSTISLFDEISSKPMYFHDFTNYLKKKVDISSKKYLISLESISYELHHQNELATLKEYKEWRDAIEHNYFFLTNSETDNSLLLEDYKDLEHVTFAKRDLFENRTMHLMQLCRSAIFSLVFLIRDESCERYFQH